MRCPEDISLEETADFIYRYYPFNYDAIVETENLCYDFINSQYIVIYRPLSETLPLSVLEEGYDAIPNLYTPLDSSNLESSGIFRTFDQPRLANKGRGTLIGIVDTGIDYQDPLFRNRDGSSRIVGLWDQTVPGSGLPGSPLDAIHYGTVYSNRDISLALQSEDPLSVIPSCDTDGHGTHMAAVAAGSAFSVPGFSGAAPEAGLVIVKLKPVKQYLRDFYLIRDEARAYQENDIMLGIKYLLLTAREQKMPLVILLGLGTNTGSHSGTSPLGLYLTDLSRSGGQVIVVAAGNETGRGHHYRGSVLPETSYEDVELRVGSGEKGFTMELWARESELYTVGFISPSGEDTGRLPVSNREERALTFLLEETVIELTYSSSEAATGSELIMMRFRSPAAGIWKIRVYHSLSIHGEYHIWLPVHDFISEETFFLRPDPDTIITDPGNAAALITTAAYNHRNEGIYIHSSRGFSRTGAIKPDFAAPGVDIPVASGQTATGTSLAASHAAGAAAILLSWAVSEQTPYYINTPIAKSILIRGAGRKPGISYPNREWGYGTLDLYNAFLSMRD